MSVYEFKKVARSVRILEKAISPRSCTLALHGSVLENSERLAQTMLRKVDSFGSVRFNRRRESVQKWRAPENQPFLK